MTETKRGKGRPMITLDDLPKDWDKKVLDLAKEGGSIIELAVLLGISRDTFYELSKRDKDFSDTIKECKSLSEAWWIRNGRTNLGNKDFSYVGWYMNMKNRFGWRDRHDVTSKDRQIPILGVTNVPTNDGSGQDTGDGSESESGAGGNLGGQDDSDTPPLDSDSPASD